MSLFRTLDRTSAVSNTTSARPFLSFLCPVLDRNTLKRRFSKNSVDNAASAPRQTPHMDTFFIQALVQAASCPKHAKRIPKLSKVDAVLPRKHNRRWSSTWPKPDEKNPNARLQRRGPFNKVKDFAEKELQALVDYYGMELETGPEKDVPDDGKLVWNVGDSHEPWPLRDPRDAVHIERLEELLKDEEASHDKMFEIYKKLPSPGVVYLKIETIRALLHHLAVVERPTLTVMQRYLSILDDMKNAHIHIIRSEWTSAIHLSGNAMGKIAEDKIQSALNIWRDMEHRAGIRGGYVTFNVLFTVSVKSGKYTLAETFLKEMQARKMPMHRHHRVSLLYYYGVLQNGNAVRRTYQELVAAGEIVDTVVMNAVIASLLRAREPSAAEHVFERMKRLHALRASPAPGHTFFHRNWRDRRLLGMHFRDEARRLSHEKNEEELKKLQDFAPIAPDSRTYGVLIRYHAEVAGNIDRVHELLQEMNWNSVPLEGTIFIVIFHGFNTFGGVRYSSWTASKLEKIWRRYLRALNEDLERTWISSLSVIAALRAFAKCTAPERTLRAWEEIRILWHHADEQELETVLRALRKLVPSQLEAQRPGFFDGKRPL